MPTISQAARNSGIVFFGRIFNLFVDFIISIYLVRYLGSNDFGIYSFVFIYISFFGFVSLSGMDKVLVRALSKNESAAERIIGNALTIRSILPMLGIFLSIIILIFLDYPPYTKFLIYITSITLFLSSLRIVYQSVFQTFLKMEYSVFSDAIGKIFYLLFVAILIFFAGNIFHLIIGIIISNFITLFANIIYSRKLVKPIFKFELNCIKKIVIPSFPLTLAGFFFVIYHRIDVFMISLMKDFTAVGYYSAAFKLIETLNLIPVTLMISFFPLMIRQFKVNKNNFLALHEHGFKMMLIIGIPLAILTSLFSKEIVLLVFGSEFMPSSDALLVLIWAEVSFFLISFILIHSSQWDGRRQSQ